VDGVELLEVVLILMRHVLQDYLVFVHLANVLVVLVLLVLQMLVVDGVRLPNLVYLVIKMDLLLLFVNNDLGTLLVLVVASNVLPVHLLMIVLTVLIMTHVLGKHLLPRVSILEHLVLHHFVLVIHILNVLIVLELDVTFVKPLDYVNQLLRLL